MTSPEDQPQAISEEQARLYSGGLIGSGVGMLAVGVACENPTPQDLQDALNQSHEAGLVSVQQAMSGTDFLDMVTKAQSDSNGAGELYAVYEHGTISYFFSVEFDDEESRSVMPQLEAMVDRDLYDHAALQARIFEGNRLIRKKAKPVHLIAEDTVQGYRYTDLQVEMVSRITRGEFSNEDNHAIMAALALIMLDKEDIWNGRYVQFGYDINIDRETITFFPNGFQK